MVNTRRARSRSACPTSPTRGEARGGRLEFTGDTFDSGVCHMAFFKDPDGNGLMLHHRYAPYSDGTSP